MGLPQMGLYEEFTIYICEFSAFIQEGVQKLIFLYMHNLFHMCCKD